MKPLNRDQIEGKVRGYLALKREVLCAYLFGSLASGREKASSDVDIAVLFSPGIDSERYTPIRLSMINELSRILDREIDVAVLNGASSFLKFQVIKYGSRIYEKEGRADRGFEARAIVEYLDFIPIRSKLEKGLIDHIKGA